MGMGVDKTRHENLASAINHVLGRKFFFELFLISYCKDAVLFDRDRARKILIEVLIHCENEGIYKKGIHLCHLCSLF
jgi:hypothetical protein